MNNDTRTVELPHQTNGQEQTKPLHSASALTPLLGNLKVKLSAYLGQTELTVADLTALTAGQVLTLDRAVEHPIDLVAEGHVVAQGNLVAVGDQFGLRITSVAKLV